MRNIILLLLLLLLINPLFHAAKKSKPQKKVIDTTYVIVDTGKSYKAAQKIEITASPNPSLNWVDFLKVFIPSLCSLLIGWLIGYIPQKRQSFQNAFFTLLQNQHTILSSITYETKIKRNGRSDIELKFTGTEYFHYSANRLREFYKFLKETNPNPVVLNTLASSLASSSFFSVDELMNIHSAFHLPGANETEIIFVKNMYDSYFKKEHFYVGQYFRNLFHIMKFADRNRFFINRKYFMKLLQAQMTSSELLLLFYNALGFKKTKRLIEKYDFIENLPVEDYINPGQHILFYNCRQKSGTRSFSHLIPKKKFSFRFFFHSD